METKVSRVYSFPSGARIDLKKIVCIGALDKDQFYNITLPVYCVGCNKPILFVLANAIGTVPPETKVKVERIYMDFIKEWEQYVAESST